LMNICKMNMDESDETRWFKDIDMG
jgi:hypothetical protein